MSGPVKLPNDHLKMSNCDYLFHLDLHMYDADVLAKFKNVKFVCVGGTPGRMESLAHHLAQELNDVITEKNGIDYSFRNERYSGFKVGPVFCVSHGIGTPSLSVMLHEVFKLLQRAECTDVTLIRTGTCGGIGVQAGTVVVSTGSLTAGLQPVYHTSSLGQPLQLPTVVDTDLVKDLLNCRHQEDKFEVMAGKTYCTDDFYQGQGRLDGSFCDYTSDDQRQFLQTLQTSGVKNMEMESAGVLAMAHRVGIRAAVVCVVLVDRLESELPTATEEQLKVFQTRPIQLVTRYIRRTLQQ